MNVVENVMSSGFYRHVHVVSMGEEPAVDEFLPLVPGEAVGYLDVYRSVEEVLGVHHLWLVWPAREGMVVVSPRAGKTPPLQGVGWYVDVAGGESVSGSLSVVVEVFRRRYGCDPGRVLLQRRSADAPGVVEVEGVRLAVEAAAWVAPRFIFVC